MPIPSSFTIVSNTSLKENKPTTSFSQKLKNLAISSPT
jgi:hypothetical protein